MLFDQQISAMARRYMRDLRRGVMSRSLTRFRFSSPGRASGSGPRSRLLRSTSWRQDGNHPLKLVGDAAVFATHQTSLIAPRRRQRHAGKPDPKNAAAVIEAIEIAVKAASPAKPRMVTAHPQAVLKEAGFPYPGHTEFLGFLTKAPRAVMMLASEKLRVVPLTIHTPLAEVPGAISKDSILETAEIILNRWCGTFAIAEPRLAVAGLNPHAGEEACWAWRKEFDRPAVQLLKARGHNVTGPLSADTLFHDEARNTMTRPHHVSRPGLDPDQDHCPSGTA